MRPNGFPNRRTIHLTQRGRFELFAAVNEQPKDVQEQLVAKSAQTGRSDGGR